MTGVVKSNGIGKGKVKKVLRYRWAVFGILAWPTSLSTFTGCPRRFVSTDLQITFGVSIAASIGLLSSIYFYAYTVMQLPSGLLTTAGDHAKRLASSRW